MLATALAATVWMSLALAFVDPTPPEVRPKTQEAAASDTAAPPSPFEYVDVGKKIPNYTPGGKWGAQGEPLTRMQLPLSPAQSQTRLIVPPGFRVELFAAEPELAGKPIAMNWDERGRLWVAETVDYPNEMQPPGQGRDRIRICEDRDGDGLADHFTVFAEHLSIPTSLIFARGGVIVFADGKTLWLKDADGDDVADERVELFGSWTQTDTHGGPSNMVYGLDNWIWATQGYNDSRLEVGGQTHRFRQGFFRFRPDGSRLEFIRSTDNNTWGLGMSEEGIVFGSTANHNPSTYMPIANRYYEAVRGWAPSLVLGTIADSHLFHAVTDRVRQVDHFGGYTAGAGHALYTAREYPREFWNRTAFVCEPTGHLVGTFVLSAKGAGFTSTSPFNLLASDDEWTAPIMAEVGPDGQVWVIDWYNYIVQHNPTPLGFKTGKGAAYETDLRDKRHGRIYRVVYEGTAGQPKPSHREPFSLHNASPDQLIAALRHSNLFWRRHAQRLLVERAHRDVTLQLCKLVTGTMTDELGLNVGAIHALWTLKGLGAIEAGDGDVLTTVFAALRHPSAGVRRNALQVLPPSTDSTHAILASEVLRDASPQVQLAALLALADQAESSEAGTALSEVAGRVTDPWLNDAITCAAAKHHQSFLTSIVANETSTDSLARMVTIVAEHQARSDSGPNLDPLLAALAVGNIRLSEAVVQGFLQGWPKDRSPQLSPQAEEQLDRLASRLDGEKRMGLVQLASRWGSERFEKYRGEIAQLLSSRLVDESQTIPARIDAATQALVLQTGDANMGALVLAQVTSKSEPDLAAGFLRALARHGSEEMGEHIVRKIPQWTPTTRSAGIRALLSRPKWTVALLEGLEQGHVQPTDLSLVDQRALSEHPDAKIRRRAEQQFRTQGSLPNTDRQGVVQNLLSVTMRQGNVSAGLAVFRKQCAKCHTHGTEGQRIGPDLTGVAAHSKAEILVQILDPSRSVEANFRVYTVATTEGQVITGLLAGESNSSIELFDTEGQPRKILRENVETLSASGKSLMPEGFEKQLSETELCDLLEFLAARGKYLPVPLDRVATAISTQGMFVLPEGEGERLIFDDWKPKTVEGVPFQLVDPRTATSPNAIVLQSPLGAVAARMPKSVTIPCSTPAKAIHLLSGVCGWGFPLGEKGSTSMIVRVTYEDGTTEDHALRNGEHFADYIRRVDVPGSQFAFDLQGRQMRYLSVPLQGTLKLQTIELLKGTDATAPVVMALTLELP